MIDILVPLIKQFMPFAQKRFGFEDPPKLFLKTDNENAIEPLGKTAFYDPQAMAITLYISGRHPKDILRSLGHELVHHKQNCDGLFDDVSDMGEGYAQSDPHLRQMEIEANRDGSMCLSDFEDELKKENTTYYEHLQKGEISKMSTKDWKNKEISTLLSEAWGFKFNSLQEFNEFNNAGEDIAEEEVQEGDIEERTKRDTPDRTAGRDSGGRRVKALEEAPLDEGSEDLEEECNDDETDVVEDKKYDKEQIKEILKKVINTVKEQKMKGKSKN